MVGLLLSVRELMIPFILLEAFILKLGKVFEKLMNAFFFLALNIFLKFEDFDQFLINYLILALYHL